MKLVSNKISVQVTWCSSMRLWNFHNTRSIDLKTQTIKWKKIQKYTIGRLFSASTWPRVLSESRSYSGGQLPRRYTHTRTEVVAHRVKHIPGRILTKFLLIFGSPTSLGKVCCVHHSVVEENVTCLCPITFAIILFEIIKGVHHSWVKASVHSYSSRLKNVKSVYVN